MSEYQSDQGFGETGRANFGGQEEAVGTRLEKATDEFLKETKSCAALQIPPGQDQLTAMEFVQYLGIDLTLEPELAWIAREMLAAPMPPNAKMRTSKAGVCYFYDTQYDYFTIEHPLTQRYLKVLERQRLDLLAIRTKPSVNGLLFNQPDMLFHKQFRNLQIPCQSCGVMQSQLKCNQCLMSFCQACYDSLHKDSAGLRQNHNTLQTAIGSLCSTCACKKPQVFCANCEDYFCFKCFEDMHRRGARLQHKSMLVQVSDGEIIEPQKRCEECEDNPAAFACDYCLDNYCVQCFWKCHFNGHRRQHTASKICVTPLCNQCSTVRATVFCEQCQELMCTDCFTMLHAKGNRMLHLFMDAMDLLLLLERLDPTFQEHMMRARPRVLWAISQLQGWTKGIDDRRSFAKRKELVTQIQRRYRGMRTRRRLLGMLQMHKWRRRQVNTYFLPKTAEERRNVRQRCAAMLAAKDVTHRAANASLMELKDTLLLTNGANINISEDRDRLKTAIGVDEDYEPDPMRITQGIATHSRLGATDPGTTAGGPDPYSTYEGSSRFGAATGGGVAGAITAGTGERGADISGKDPRKARDTTYREITRLDNK